VGGSITCRVFSAGAFPIENTSRKIFNNLSIPVTILTDSCNVTIKPTGYCAYAGRITGMFELGRDDNVRGVAEIQHSSHAVLKTVPLTK
jgi:hypothetical protein